MQVDDGGEQLAADDEINKAHGWQRLGPVATLAMQGWQLVEAGTGFGGRQVLLLWKLQKANPIFLGLYTPCTLIFRSQKTIFSSP